MATMMAILRIEVQLSQTASRKGLIFCDESHGVMFVHTISSGEIVCHSCRLEKNRELIHLSNYLFDQAEFIRSVQSYASGDDTTSNMATMATILQNIFFYFISQTVCHIKLTFCVEHQVVW